VTERLSYCPRERRLVARVRLNLPHIEAVRAARTAFLDSHHGTSVASTGANYFSGSNTHNHERGCVTMDVIIEYLARRWAVAW
jgi:hypothetical protein